VRRLVQRVLLLGTFAASGFAQLPANVEIIAPSVRLTAGDSMALSAIALSSTGVPVSFTQALQWSVDQPSIAKIDSSGNLTGVSLGVVLVTATSGNLTHNTSIQVVPDHVSISPTSAALNIGDSVQFSASAFDKNGNAIPNINFTWAITSNADDGKPYVGYGTISPTGLLTGIYEGTAYVRALYTYVSPTGSVEAGMENRIPIYAPFVTSAPRPFTVQRLLDAAQQQLQNPKLRAKPSLLWTLPDGRLLFNASLDGLGTALLAWDGANFTPVLSTGTPSNSAGSIVTDLGRHAVSLGGGLLTQQSTTDGGMVQFGTADFLQPLLVSNSSAAGAENLNNFTLSRNSLTTSGNFVVIGNFKIPGTNVFVSGLFRGAGTTVNQVLFSQADTLPELGVSGVNVSDFGVDDNGVAWYIANLPGKQTMYRHDQTGRTKILGVGDPLLGSTVRFLSGNRNSSPASFFAENGDMVTNVNLNSGPSYLVRYTAPDYSEPVQSQQIDSGVGILAYSNDGTVMLYANPHPNRGDGAWLWKGASLESVVLVGKTLVNGQPIQSIESGAFDGSGNAILMVTTTANPMIVIRVAPGNAPQVLFQAGDAAGVQVPSFFATFVPGGRSGPPFLMAGSNTNASIAQSDGGAVHPLLSLGDQVLNSIFFAGVNPYGSTQRTSNGDLYTILPNVGVARYSNGAWDLPLPFPIKLDDSATAYLPYRIAVNDSGAMAWAAGTDKGDTRVYLSQNGRNQLICSNGVYTQAGALIDGKNVYGCDDFTLDNANRILLRLHFQNDPAQWSYAWNNGGWQLAVQIGQTLIAGRAVQSVNIIRASGSRTLAVVNTDAGSNIVEWTDSGWFVLYSPASTMPTGFLLTYVNYMEPVGNGDLVFVSQAFPSLAVFSLRGGTLSTVLTTGRRTTDGDFLVNILGLDVRADGSIYLLALNERDELVLYNATLTQ
jgi:hypothetical protein